MDIHQNEMDRLANKLHNRYIGVEPLLLIIVIAVIIIYYYLFSSLGNNENGYTSSLKLFVEIVLWLLFIILLLLNGIAYIFGIDLIKTLKTTFGIEEKKSDGLDGDVGGGRGDDLLKIALVKQVFHIPDNKYNYEDAKALCNAYDSRLASYDEVNDAHAKGADWCSYGWSEDQMALYPTQRDKWKKLQNQKGHEQDCGRPGVNGGYMNDAKLTFGVNCYGSKPSITPCQAKAMQNAPFIHKTAKELEFDKKVEYWRTQLPNIKIAPFNHNNWAIL
jgi:hypothetical protein